MEALFATLVPFPGLIAWSARTADRKLSGCTYTQGLSLSKLQHALHLMSVAVEGLRAQRLEPVQLCWVFEQGRLHFASRPNGTCLALLVDKDSNSATAQAERLLAEYIQLPDHP